MHDDTTDHVEPSHANGSIALDISTATTEIANTEIPYLCILTY